MTVIGLTGPTGAGKSTVAVYLDRLGAAVIDADKLAKEATMPGHPCLRMLAERFGEEIVREDGSLDRALLASRAFATPETRQALNAITHPFVIARSKELLADCRSPLAVIDAPLLFESGMDALCDVTVAVLAPLAVRKARIIERDGLTSERADERIAAQKDDEFYRDRATACVVNDGDREHLLAQIDTLIGEAE